MRDSYETPLNSRYASKEMQYIFSPDFKFKTWRKLWIALAESEMELGLNVTQEQVDELKAHADVRVVDAASLASKLGNPKVSNIILLGTIIKLMGLESIDWDAIIRATVKPAFIDINLKALEVGMNAV